MDKRATGATAMAALLGLAFSAPGEAQVNRFPGGQGRPGLNRQQPPAPKNFNKELQAVADELGKKYNAQVVVDPAIFVPLAPKAPSDVVNLEGALNMLASSYKGTAWRRVYTKGGPVTPLKLVQTVRAMDTLEQSGIVVEDTVAKRTSTFVKNIPVTPNFAEDLRASEFNPAPTYVLYARIEGAGKSMEDRFVDLQRQQMEMMLEMSPDQMAQAMSNSMQMFSQMDPSVRSQFMGNMMKAGMQMWQSMPEGDRQQMIQGIMQSVQGAFGPGGPGAPGGFPGGPGAPGGPVRRP